MLFKYCRFLVNPTKDIDLRKWAAEGLAYLTLDADVKEDLVADTPALRSLMDLAKVTNFSKAEIVWLSYVSFQFAPPFLSVNDFLVGNRQGGPISSGANSCKCHK